MCPRTFFIIAHQEEDAAMNRFRLMLAIIASGILIAGYLILPKESKGQEVSDPCNRQVLQRDVRMFKEEKDAIQARLKDVMDEGELVSAQIISLGQMVAEPKEFCRANPRSCVMAAQLARGFALLNGEAEKLHEKMKDLEKGMQDRMEKFISACKKNANPPQQEDRRERKKNNYTAGTKVAHHGRPSSFSQGTTEFFL